VQYNLNRSPFVRIFVVPVPSRCPLGTGYRQRSTPLVCGAKDGASELPNCDTEFLTGFRILLVQTCVNLWDQSVPDRRFRFGSTESQARFKSASGCPETASYSRPVMTRNAESFVRVIFPFDRSCIRPRPHPPGALEAVSCLLDITILATKAGLAAPNARRYGSEEPRRRFILCADRSDRSPDRNGGCPSSWRRRARTPSEIKPGWIFLLQNTPAAST
jgi:hypothetical protein